MQSYEFVPLVVCKEWEMTLENEGAVDDSGRQSASNFVSAVSKVLQQKNGGMLDSRVKSFFCNIHWTKINFLYPVLQKMVQKFYRENTRGKNGIRFEESALQ